MSSDQDAFRKRVFEFYEKHNPKKSRKAIDWILQRYEGKEDLLFENLRLKYIILPTQKIQRAHEQTVVMLTDIATADLCRIANHIHLTITQCNLLLYGYIRCITDIFIADDIYKLCWNLFLKINQYHKIQYETGELYQGYECQIREIDFKCHDSNDLIYLRFAYDHNDRQEQNEIKLDYESSVSEYNPFALYDEAIKNWTVKTEQKGKYDQVFYSWSLSAGRASGQQIAKYVLSQTGLLDSILSKIWEICDFESRGSLTHDQFCLFMFIVDKYKETGEIIKITEELIPPGDGWRDIWKKYPINLLNLRLSYFDSQGEVVKAGGTYKGIQRQETFTQQTHTMHPYQIWNDDYLLGVYMPVSSHPHHLISLKNDDCPEGVIIHSCDKGTV